MTRRPDEPSVDDMDAILRFLPVLESPGFVAGQVHPAGETDGEKHEAFFEASPELNALIQALVDHHWVFDFDWTEWQPVAERYVQQPALLGDAGVGTVRKLFSTHVHKERYVDGHLGAMARSGHLLALLRRVRDLRDAARG